jgi:hypothetical protein
LPLIFEFDIAIEFAIEISIFAQIDYKNEKFSRRITMAWFGS